MGRSARSELLHTKNELRSQCLALRHNQPLKEDLSRLVFAKLMAMPDYASSETILFYVDVRDEVRTRFVLPEILSSGKRLAVPYCVGDSLELFLLRDADELEKGTFGVLEPARRLRTEAGRQIEPEALDIAVVPGVAFDRMGGRLGYGKGFYDRMLPRTRHDAVLIGAAFDCQIVDCVPMEPHDRPVDFVITPSQLYSRKETD